MEAVFGRGAPLRGDAGRGCYGVWSGRQADGSDRGRVAGNR